MQHERWNRRVAAFLLGAGLAGCVAWMVARTPGQVRRRAAARVDARLDEALEDSFPASDPPAMTGTPRAI